MLFLTVAPISPQFTDFHRVFRDTVDFGNGLRIQRTPGEFKEWSATLRARYGDRSSLSAPLAFTCEFEAPRGLGSRDHSWPGHGSIPVEVAAINRIRFLNVALWLAQPTGIGFDIYAHVPLSPDSVFAAHAFDPLVPLPSYASGDLHPAAVERGAALFRILETLPRESSVYASLRSLWFALVTDQWDVRFLLLWLGLESLFGDGASASARWAAAFIGEEGEDLKALVDDTAKSYSLRSKIAHGVSLVTSDPLENQRAVHEVEGLLRRSLNRLLLGDRGTLEDFFSERTRKRRLTGREKARMPVISQVRTSGRPSHR